MKKLIILVFTLTMMSNSFVACNSGENSRPTASFPFMVSGSYFELSGENAIYAPNGTYDFNLIIRNDTDEEWKGNCYVFLVDKNGPLMDISDIGINLLNRGEQDKRVITLALPGNIEPGAYGLALIFHDKGYIIQTIYVGDSISNEPAGPWPDIFSYQVN